MWMDQRPLDLHRRYLLKHTSQTVPAFVSSIDHRIDLATLAREPAPTLRMNDIGAVSLSLLRPIALDLYGENRATGAFILIDPETNATVAAGMVTAASDSTAAAEDDEAAAWGRVTPGESEARWGHRGGVLALRPVAAYRRHRALAVCRGRCDRAHRYPPMRALGPATTHFSCIPRCSILSPVRKPRRACLRWCCATAKTVR